MTFFASLLNPDPHNPVVDATFKRLIDQFFVIFLISGTLSLTGSLLRTVEHGWMFQQIIHTAVYLLMITGFIFRKHFSVNVITMYLLTMAGIDAVTNLYIFGLASTGTLMLGYIIIMTALFIGFRAGIIALVTGMILLTGFGAAISTGRIPMNFNETEYVTSWTAWITQISTFLVMITTAVVAGCSIKSRLLVSLHDLNTRTAELTDSNRDLVKSEKQIRTIVETAPEAITTTDLDGKITSCNQASLKLLGYHDASGIIGSFCGDLVAEKDRKKTFAAVKMSGQLECVRDIEFELITRSGGTIPVKTVVSMLRDKNDEPYGYLIITQDITKAREIDEHLRHAEKMEAIGQLAGGIAHDFNNQLTGIIGFAEILKCDFPDDTEHIEDIDAIIQTARRASSLTAQLLAFARKGTNESVPFDLHQVIIEVIRMLQRTINKNITIIEFLEAEHPMVIGDPAQIQNVILNLALNARDAMPKGGSLTLSTLNTESVPVPDFNKKYDSEHYIRLTVRDTGIGMSEDLQKKIFNPFFTTKDQGKGTGMGLASAYGTITSHQGVINVTSEPDKGTSMTIYLPGIKTIQKPVEHTPRINLQHSHQATILLVDDEEIVVNYTSRLLRKNGYNVTVRTDGLEAVDYYTEHWKSIDLVILDMVMPIMDGNAAYQRMKKINDDIHVLFCSGHDPKGVMHEVRMEKGVDFISKPFHIGSFLDKIEGIVAGLVAQRRRKNGRKSRHADVGRGIGV
jgi:two-component system, cell cycle sensor histidine kinase and response regulator CckA